MNLSKTTTYLVTGAAGFIGSRFVKSCNAKEIAVISVDDEPLFNSRPELLGINFGTIIDREALWNWLKQESPQISAIIHLGAITDTRETDLAKLNHSNVFYSQKLWTYSATHQIPLVYASSAATYGDGSYGYNDDEQLISQLAPLNAYGDSKQKFDCWVLDQEKHGNSPKIWSGYKFFNVYGYGEGHKGFMSSVVLHAYDQIQTTGKVTLFKSHREGIPDGHQKRDFISVDDVVAALHFALKKPIYRGIYNLGTGRARTFLDLARSVFAALNRPERIEFIDTPVILREKYQYFTEARMERFISQGFSTPLRSIEEGVREYIDQLNLKTPDRR